MLLRARAIENGCFVIAPGQVGEHLPGRECFGHSMIVDPWGTVLAEVQDGVGFCVADLDLGRVAEVRAQIPSLQNRRPEAYDLLGAPGSRCGRGRHEEPGSGARGRRRRAALGQPPAHEGDDDADHEAGQGAGGDVEREAGARSANRARRPRGGRVAARPAWP